MDKNRYELLRRYVESHDDDEQMKIHQWYDRLCKSDEIRLSEKKKKMLLEDKLWKNNTDLQTETLFGKEKAGDGHSFHSMRGLQPCC